MWQCGWNSREPRHDPARRLVECCLIPSESIMSSQMTLPQNRAFASTETCWLIFSCWDSWRLKQPQFLITFSFEETLPQNRFLKETQVERARNDMRGLSPRVVAAAIHTPLNRRRTRTRSLIQFCKEQTWFETVRRFPAERGGTTVCFKFGAHFKLFWFRVFSPQLCWQKGGEAFRNKNKNNLLFCAPCFSQKKCGWAHLFGLLHSLAEFAT